MCREAQMVFLDMQKMVSWYVIKKNWKQKKLPFGHQIKFPLVQIYSRMTAVSLLSPRGVEVSVITPDGSSSLAGAHNKETHRWGRSYHSQISFIWTFKNYLDRFW